GTSIKLAVGVACTAVPPCPHSWADVEPGQPTHSIRPRAFCRALRSASSIAIVSPSPPPATVAPGAAGPAAARSPARGPAACSGGEQRLGIAAQFIDRFEGCLCLLPGDVRLELDDAL